MGNDLSNTATVQADFVNSFTQNLDSTCSANCNIEINDNTIIVGSGTTVDGDIVISGGDGCQADASCSMSQSAQATAESIMKSMLDQELTTTTGLFGDFQSTDVSNEIDVSTNVSNYITQISSQTCQANSTLTVDDNTIYVDSGSTVNGGISITGGGGSSATASCSMTNMAKLATYNQQSTEGSQNGSTKGMITMIAICIAVCVVIGGIVLVVLLAGGTAGAIFLGKELIPEGGIDLDPAVVAQFAGDFL